MAGTAVLNLQATFTAQNATLAAAIQASITTTGNDYARLTQDVTTSAVAVGVGNCASIGRLIIRCLASSAGDVVVYHDSGATNQMHSLAVGDFCVITKPAAAPYVKKAAGTGVVEIMVWEQ